MKKSLLSLLLIVACCACNDMPGNGADGPVKPFVIAVNNIYATDYYPDKGSDGAANYFLAFGTAAQGPDDNFSDGYVFVLDMYGEAAPDDAAASLPAGRYEVRMGGTQINQINAALSGVKQYNAAGEETLSNNFYLGTVSVSYDGNICTIRGACTAGEEYPLFVFEYTGELLFRPFVEERINTTFTTVVRADYWGDTWSAGTGNYEVVFADAQGRMLVLNLNDTPPIQDVLRISPGTYSADFGQTGEAGHYIAGGMNLIGEPYGTFVVLGDEGYLIDGGTVSVAYDEAGGIYTFGVKLESSGGLLLEGSYTGELDITGHGVSTDRIDAVLTQSDNDFNYLYYDGADTEGYSQFTLALQNDNDALPNYRFSFDLYCPNEAIDTANPVIPAQTYLFDEVYKETGETYTHQYGCTYDWSMLEYITELDDGSFFFNSGQIVVTHTPAGYRIEATLTEEENDMPIHLVYEGAISWDSSDLPENSGRKPVRIPRNATAGSMPKAHTVRQALPARIASPGPIRSAALPKYAFR